MNALDVKISLFIESVLKLNSFLINLNSANSFENKGFGLNLGINCLGA